jgi:hypothetical protein
MIADPQSITIAPASALSLPRVSSGVDSGRFSSADNSVVETISSSYGKRTRRTWRVVHSKVVPDPLFPAQNVPYSMTFYVVADVPRVGYTVAEQKAVVDGFISQLNASSGLLITKFLGGEN